MVIKTINVQEEARTNVLYISDRNSEKKSNPKEVKATSISYADYVQGIKQRGFDDFFVAGKRIKVDTTDFSKIDMENLLLQIAEWKRKFYIIDT